MDYDPELREALENKRSYETIGIIRDRYSNMRDFHSLVEKIPPLIIHEGRDFCRREYVLNSSLWAFGDDVQKLKELKERYDVFTIHPLTKNSFTAGMPEPTYEMAQFIVENTPPDTVLYGMFEYRLSKYPDLFYRLLEKAKDKKSALRCAVSVAWREDNLAMMKALNKNVPEIVAGRVTNVDGRWYFLYDTVRQPVHQYKKAMSPETRVVDRYLLEKLGKIPVKTDPPSVEIDQEVLVKTMGKNLAGLVMKYL